MIREVPRDEVEVTVDVYPMKEIATIDESSDGNMAYTIDSDQRTVISTGEEDQESNTQNYTISIPDLPNSQIYVTQDMMDSYETLALIKWKSPYFLRAILWDIEEVDGERIMYIEHYRTTVLNSRQPNGGSYTTSIEFGNLSKIIYLEKDGSETVLWENN